VTERVFEDALQVDEAGGWAHRVEIDVDIMRIQRTVLQSVIV
jgi:hypothetical protein